MSSLLYRLVSENSNVVGFVIFALGLLLFYQLFYKKLLNFLLRKEWLTGYVLVYILYRPVLLYSWIIVIYKGFSLLHEAGHLRLFPKEDHLQVVHIILLLFIGLLVVLYLMSVLNKLITRGLLLEDQVNKPVVEFVTKLLQYVFFLLFLFVSGMMERQFLLRPVHFGLTAVSLLIAIYVLYFVTHNLSETFRKNQEFIGHSLLEAAKAPLILLVLACTLRYFSKEIYDLLAGSSTATAPSSEATQAALQQAPEAIDAAILQGLAEFGTTWEGIKSSADLTPIKKCAAVCSAGSKLFKQAAEAMAPKTDGSPSLSIRGVFKMIDYGTICLCCLFWAFFRLTSLIERQLLSGNISKGNLDDTLVQATTNLVRIGLCIAGVSVVAHKAGKSLATLLTALGTGTAIMSFAARDLLANYLSGFAIYYERYFKVGEWICSTDKKIEGMVEYISLRATTLRTPDKQVLYVPNSFFTANSFINMSRMTHRKISKKIPLGWLNEGAVIDTVINEIRAVVYNHPGIDKTLPLQVHLTDLEPGELSVTISAFTRSKNSQTALNVQESILKEVKKIIERNEALAPGQQAPTLAAPA